MKSCVRLARGVVHWLFDALARDPDQPALRRIQRKDHEPGRRDVANRYAGAQIWHLVQQVWNPNNKEIFYRIGDRMMSVAVTAVGNDLQLATPQQLFARGYASGAGITIANYDVTKDGRFIVVRDDATVGRLRVVQNWHADSVGPAAAR